MGDEPSEEGGIHFIVIEVRSFSTYTGAAGWEGKSIVYA